MKEHLDKISGCRVLYDTERKEYLVKYHSYDLALSYADVLDLAGILHRLISDGTRRAQEQ